MASAARVRAAIPIRMLTITIQSAHGRTLEPATLP
jgi:hypothetical protein